MCGVKFESIKQLIQPLGGKLQIKKIFNTPKGSKSFPYYTNVFENPVTCFCNRLIAQQV